MSWTDVFENPYWEYSTTPNADKKSQDTYEYDVFSGHFLGIRTNTDLTEIYVLARQKTIYSEHPGYGELLQLKYYTLGTLIKQPISTLTESRPCYVITGGSISVDSGEYSIDGGVWTAVAGTISAGSYFKVRILSSGLNNTPVTVIATVDSQDIPWIMTTESS